MRSHGRLIPGAFVVLVGCTQVIGIDGEYTLIDDEGGGGTGTGTGAVSCPDEPTPPGGACPAECSGGCDGATCIIDCSQSSCSSVSCPADFACEVDCTSGSCNGAQITCPPEQACEIACEGSMNCRDASITCGNGPCLLSCGSGNQVCRDADVSCGPHRCQATCSSSSNTPSLACNDSCDCRPC